MKTVVVGVFDQLTDAGRVIAQLAASPLDMDSVQVVHADTRVQERLAAEAGLPTRRAAGSLVAVGALLGALVGFWAGGGFGAAETPALIGLGPLPSLAGGLLLGAILGLLAGVFGERTEIPLQDREGLLVALGDGATVVAVRTENLPTARAIGDLFRAGGSRILDGGPPPRRAAPASGRPPASAATGDMPFGLPLDEGSPAASTPPDEHQAFVPPWRRAGGDGGSAAGDDALAATDDTPFTLFPEAGASSPATASLPSAREIRHGDVLTGLDHSSRAVEFPEVAPLPAERATAAATPFAPPAPDRLPALVDLGLPARVVRALEAHRVTDAATLHRLATEDPRALDLIPGVGPMAQRQIRAALEAAGFSWES